MILIISLQRCLKYESLENINKILEQNKKIIDAPAKEPVLNYFGINDKISNVLDDSEIRHKYIPARFKLSPVVL